MSLSDLLELLKTNPTAVNFQDVIETIDTEYDYTPSKFINGEGELAVVNDKSTNEGSCKILAFSILNNLSKEQTLNCFGDYYRKDVLLNPDNSDHANIRNLIKFGIEKVIFENEVLIKR